jgi:double-stranded uracil-DNA glycosylase
VSRRGPTRAELEASRGRVVDDLVGGGLRLLFVGINPGLWSAATGSHFARPGNRFYSALFRAGITEYRIDASTGMTDADRRYLIRRGIGITNVVARATARADELGADELRAGAAVLESLVERCRPRVVAVLGLTAYRTAFERRKARAGRQPDLIAGVRLWVVPNPSGLNAHENIDSLAVAYRAPALAAGIRVGG